MVGTLGDENGLKVDEQTIGIAVAGAGMAARMSMLAAIALGTVTTAVLRLIH